MSGGRIRNRMTEKHDDSRELKLAVKASSAGEKEKALIVYDPSSVSGEYEDVYDDFVEEADEIDYEAELETEKRFDEAVDAILEEYSGNDVTKDGVATITLWKEDAERLEQDLEEKSEIL